MLPIGFSFLLKEKDISVIDESVDDSVSDGVSSEDLVEFPEWQVGREQLVRKVIIDSSAQEENLIWEAFDHVRPDANFQRRARVQAGRSFPLLNSAIEIIAQDWNF